MNHLLYINVSNQQAVLERMLRVTRHRGFEIQSFVVQPDMDSSRFQISMTVDGKASIQLLKKQLEKLNDVQQVRLASGEETSLPVFKKPMNKLAKVQPVRVSA